jgi:uncharacterized membrane protein YkvA (DUF1232 family)
VKQRLLAWAKRLRQDSLALWFAARHPGTPLAPKLLALLLAAYAFSPIDLIPDFIPVLGYLDEAILLPLGIALCLRMIPPPVLEACRAQAAGWLEARRGKPASRWGAAFIVAVWIATGVLLWSAVAG